VRNVIAAILLGGFACAVTAAVPPDLTGIWTMDPEGRGGAALNGPGDFERKAPFTPQAQAKLAEYHALVDPTGDTPGAHCVAHGMPLAVFLGGGYPVEFVQRPEQLTIIYETHAEVRRVFLDGRRIDPRDVLPSRGGTSMGRWEGETLVVESTNFTDYEGFRGATPDVKIVERFTRVAADKIEYRFTIEDPKAFTQPWSGEIPFHRTEGPIYEYACHEGNYALPGVLAGAREEEKARSAASADGRSLGDAL
jgi:hypothetical protein